jgi:hypothetical protein
LEASRRDPDEPLEVAGEVTLTGEADLRGNVHQGQGIPVMQQFLRAFDSASDNVLMRGQTCAALKKAREVVRTHASHGG